jgi:hypothetical protein
MSQPGNKKITDSGNDITTRSLTCHINILAFMTII